MYVYFLLMTIGLFEQLLQMPESEFLDFKRTQYPFIQATDDEKSELLKDICLLRSALTAPRRFTRFTY